MLKGKPQAAAVLGLVVIGIVVGAVVTVLDVQKPWTYVVMVVLGVAAVAFMRWRFDR
ncbi:hypothetical protein SAMN05216553_112168 [Lentzea fradiae]|uniref:Uncharacterized protein n=1 Tax=Lentzea fradiae TaxID=200378 RepID=A0A1G7XQR1_9PSEU|nr:hypothetical protein [Lentzea fradiae]SDG86555.1 hypothetical protein SAMN05216553_112168 [Lentzea fradiae]